MHLDTQRLLTAVVIVKNVYTKIIVKSQIFTANFTAPINVYIMFSLRTFLSPEWPRPLFTNHLLSLSVDDEWSQF